MAAAATSIGTYLEVPVINAAGLLTGLSWPHDDTVKQISAACEQWGFFQITNHGCASKHGTKRVLCKSQGLAYQFQGSTDQQSHPVLPAKPLNSQHFPVLLLKPLH